MADANNMVSNGLPPRYLKPSEILVMNQNHSTSSTYLNVKVPTEMNMKHGIAGSLHKAKDDAFSSSGMTIYGLNSTTMGAGTKGVGESNKKTYLEISSQAISYIMDLKSKRIEINPKMDPEKMRRIFANRIHGQNYRQRKLEHIAKLERKVHALQADVSLMNSQISKYNQEMCELVIENNNLKQELAVFTNEKQFKEAQFVMLTEEKDHLMDLLERQQQVLLLLQPSM